MEQLSISLSQIFGISSAMAVLISIAIGAIWLIFFNRIKEGQKAEFQKQIENLKAKNENLNYISKTQFEAEFKIYQELSEPIFDMFFDVIKLFPEGLDYVPEDIEKRKTFYEKRYNDAMDKLLIFQKKLYVYAPFIPLEIYKKYNNFRIEARKQVNWYPDFIINPQQEIIAEFRTEKKECWERTKILMEQYEGITNDLRTYLSSLKVNED